MGSTLKTRVYSGQLKSKAADFGIYRFRLSNHAHLSLMGSIGYTHFSIYLMMPLKKQWSCFASFF